MNAAYRHNPYHERPCTTCKARAGEPCQSGNWIYTDGWVHKARQAGGLRLMSATTQRPAPVLSDFRMVHCPHCGAKPGEPCHTAAGVALRTHHTARLRRCRAARAMVISAAKVTSAAMIAGNEKKFSRVIMGGHVRTWVGIGWLDDGPPGPDDDLLPRVIEPVIAMPPRTKS